MPPASGYSFPAPIRGLQLNESVAMPAPGGALVLDNFICETKDVRPRGGTKKYATLGAKVESLFSYISGPSEQFFGATASGIFEITTVADADVAPSADVTGQTSGRYSTEQFGISSGEYLLAVNGTDDAQLYDGVSWSVVNSASTPAITGVSTDSLSHVWSFASRIFFVEKGTLSAHYLPADSIGGAATEFSLAGVFQKGGELLFGATWSLDSGSGLDDKCVFFSSEGEVAVYEGSNPSSASTWARVGVYDITKPLGRNGRMRAGGDLIVATEVGMVPLSQAISKDPASLSLNAITAAIAPYWQEQAGKLSSLPWEVKKWPQKDILVVSQPSAVSAGNMGTCLVANLQTSAWSRFTGVDTQCLGYFNDFVYYGDTSGAVRQMEVGGSDDGAVYTAVYIGQHDPMGAAGAEKTVTQVRGQFLAGTPVEPRISVLANYSTSVPPAPNSPADFATDTWDAATWGTSLWDSSAPVQSLNIWSAASASGFMIAPIVQMTFGYSTLPDVRLVSVDVMYRIGEVVT